MSDFLKKLYYDPKTGYVAARYLYEKARELDPKLTLKIVKEWYATRPDIQRFQEQKRQYDGLKIASQHPNSWQMDLVFWEKQPILIVIDINSRIGYAKFLKNMTASIVLTAQKAFIRSHEADDIKSDNRSEFMNKQAQSWFK